MSCQLATKEHLSLHSYNIYGVCIEQTKCVRVQSWVCCFQTIGTPMCAHVCCFQTIGTPMCAHVCPFLVVQQSSFLICVKADMCERDFWL